MYNNLSQFEILTLQQENKNFILAVIVAVITFISAVIVYCDYKNRKNKERAEKSILIAEEFAKSIVEPVSIIYAHFEQFGIDKLVNKINFMQFTDFDIEELETLYLTDTITEYNNLINAHDPKHELRGTICETLNNLEYMCMYISTGVADEKYIYNSLHQQFLKAIALLYFEISKVNIDNKDKYYTNIIQVYNIWKNKYIKAEEKEKKLKEQTKREQEKLKKQAKKFVEKYESNKKEYKNKLKPKMHKIK